MFDGNRINEMKIGFSKKEWEHLGLVFLYTDQNPEDGILNNDIVELELSVEDWEDLNGFVAAEANHAETKDQQIQLDSIHEKIEVSILQQN